MMKFKKQHNLISSFLKSSSANPVKLFINKIDTDSYLSEIKRHDNKATQSIKFYTQALPRILLFELTIVIMKWNGLWFVMNFIYYVYALVWLNILKQPKISSRTLHIISADF